MKFKYILTTFAAAGALMLTSCEGMLDIPQHGVLNYDDYYQTYRSLYGTLKDTFALQAQRVARHLD